MRFLREMGLVWCLMFAAAVVAASWLGTQAVAGIAEWAGASQWRATPARVTQVIRTFRGYRRWQVFEIHYEYDLDGRRHEGWYQRADPDARPGESVPVIVDPARPGRSVRSRSDLAHAGVSEINTLGFYGATLMSVLLLATLASQGWQKAARLRLLGRLSAADQAALQAYFHGSPEEALARLREFGELLGIAGRSDAKDYAWQRLLARNQLRRLGRMATLHRAAARQSEAESCVQAAFDHSRMLAHEQPPLDPPIEYSGHVYRYVQAEDHRVREEAAERAAGRSYRQGTP